MFKWFRNLFTGEDHPKLTQDVRNILRAQTQRILDIRKLKVIETNNWWETGVVLENPGKASLRFSVDYRDCVIDVEFMSPVHLDDDHTFVKWPYCDDPFHRFSLWRMLEAEAISDPILKRRPKVTNPQSVQEYVAHSVDVIIERYLQVLDGDLSIAGDIAVNRHPSEWDSTGE